jgi:hypothetical protein
LRRVQARVAGVVLNGVERSADRYYYYDYRGGRKSSRGLIANLRNRIADLV